MTAHKGLKILTVRKLHKQFPAVALNHRKRIEFPRVPIIRKRAKVSPVNFKPVPRTYLNPHKCPLFSPGADRPQVISNI
jgi:hypothetical protein